MRDAGAGQRGASARLVCSRHAVRASLASPLPSARTHSGRGDSGAEPYEAPSLRARLAELARLGERMRVAASRARSGAQPPVSQSHVALEVPPPLQSFTCGAHASSGERRPGGCRTQGAQSRQGAKSRRRGESRQGGQSGSAHGAKEPSSLRPGKASKPIRISIRISEAALDWVGALSCGEGHPCDD